MSQFDQPWQKLTALARQAPVSDDLRPPLGFSTRVAAQAAALPRPGPWKLLESLAWRGLFAGGACCVAAVAFDFTYGKSELTADTVLEDTVNSMVAELS